MLRIAREILAAFLPLACIWFALTATMMLFLEVPISLLGYEHPGKIDAERNRVDSTLARIEGTLISLQAHTNTPEQEARRYGKMSALLKRKAELLKKRDRVNSQRPLPGWADELTRITVLWGPLALLALSITYGALAKKSCSKPKNP